jgi:hypothetical protein
MNTAEFMFKETIYKKKLVNDMRENKLPINQNECQCVIVKHALFK